MRVKWVSGLRRFWFRLRNLSLRGRFFFGKASYIDADIQKTDSSLTEVFDENGNPLGRRLLAHYQLVTRMPRTGAQGWNLFEQNWNSGPNDSPVSLECAYCGHLFVIRVRRETDPLSAGLHASTQLGTPVSCRSEWFSYMCESFSGESTLSCTHCEQSGSPHVSLLS